MDSKTAKAVDKALLRVEKELARLKRVWADIQADVHRHYAKPAKPKKDTKVQ